MLSSELLLICVVKMKNLFKDHCYVVLKDLLVTNYMLKMKSFILKISFSNYYQKSFLKTL